MRYSINTGWLTPSLGTPGTHSNAETDNTKYTCKIASNEHVYIDTVSRYGVPMIAGGRRRTGYGLVLMAVLVGLVVILLIRPGPAPTGAVSQSTQTPAAAGARSLDPQPTAGPAAEGTVQAPTLDSLPADTRQQFDALPAGTVLVACSPVFAKYPDGVVPSVGLGWSMTHPGWHEILHGFCVDNPSMIRSFDPAQVDATTTP